tara:strand:+ start:4334 stop:4507 length:174 start_codon:yes stop_codon:yes gene_type:complete
VAEAEDGDGGVEGRDEEVAGDDGGERAGGDDDVPETDWDDGIAGAESDSLEWFADGM